MWLFKKHISLKESGIFDGFTDWHSHILPGVDDGVQTIEESLEILCLYEALGVKSVWLTPHIMEDIPNKTAFLRVRFDELRGAYCGTIKLHLAAEYMLDNLIEERLEQNDLLPLGDNGNQLLVETSYFNPPMNLYTTLERIKSKGYYPVLAHPERYVYLSESDYQKLKNMNVKFQLNLSSLIGSYGVEIKKKAERLLKKGFYDLVGSDIHRLAFAKTTIESGISCDLKVVRS